MSTIAKIIEVSASSDIGFEEAVQDGLTKAAKSLKNIKGAWVSETKVRTEADGRIKEWRVSLRVTFIVD